MIPEPVRERDLVGYGRTPPRVRVAGRRPRRHQPRARLRGGHRVLGALGRRSQRRLGRVRRARRGAAAARSRHRVALRVRQPGRGVAAGPDLRRRRRAGDRVGGGRRARAQPRGRRSGCASTATTCSATAGAGSSRGRCRASEEREQIARAVETFERVLGSRPLGWNCRSWPSENTRELLLEAGGFIYDSDGSADDVPYYERGRRRAVPGRAVLEDLQRLPLPDQPGIRQPARLPRHRRHGSRRARARGRRAAHDDDRRRPRALVRPGGPGGGGAAVHRVRAGAARGAVHAPRGHRPLVAGALPARRDAAQSGSHRRAAGSPARTCRRSTRPTASQLVAACDLDLERAEAIAGPRGAHAYARWEEMLEREQLDLLWVCTPPLHHRAPVVAALAAGVHVYLEKPIARTLEDAEAIVAAAGAAAGAVCAVGYQWHATELLEDARAALARPAGRHAGRPQLRPGGGPAVVHGPGPGRWPGARAREPPHRPAASARGRDLGRRPGGGGIGAAGAGQQSPPCCSSQLIVLLARRVAKRPQRRRFRQ